MITPASLEELTEAVRSTARLLPVGAQTKLRLSTMGVPKLSILALRGITEYDPGEFTFTALAGTPVREIEAALAKEGQYLPFDPMLVAAGSTLGGMVASGLSGPGRLRFGGVRDFILGVRFVDGMGRLMRMGGKVVKNAAGFDLPKFLVGSLGRFGIIAEMTFKVFPRPSCSCTLRLSFDGPAAAVSAMTAAAQSRWEPEALELLPDGRSVLMRLSAPLTALEALTGEVLERWSGDVLSDAEARTLWADLGEFRWAHENGSLIKVPLTAAQVPAFFQAMAEVRTQVSAGGDVAFVSLPPESDSAAFNAALESLGLSGLTLRGSTPLWQGARRHYQISAAVKQALDPQNRFPSFDD
jgi:glycolate oxidase FAD binding subunit